MAETMSAPALAEASVATARPAHRGLAYGLRRFTRRRLAVVGIVLVGLELLLAVAAPALAPYAPNAQDFRAVLQPPGWPHVLGTDDLGRDILSRLLHGARLSLAVGVAVVAIPTYTRLMRGQILSVKQNDYVLAVFACGASIPRILFRHMLPNSIAPIVVQASLGIGFAIITESSLSFIGLGAQPPTATWGSMVQVGFQYLEIAPWFVLAPAAMIFLAVLGFNLLGDGLRDALDPSLRG